jgi:hypothetical protein
LTSIPQVNEEFVGVMPGVYLKELCVNGAGAHSAASQGSRIAAAPPEAVNAESTIERTTADIGIPPNR